MRFPRASGILLHPTSLPGRFGIGDLGPEARRFAEFLQAAGQTLWQVLPLGPTGYGDSPYQCFSAMAGNPLLISLEDLGADVGDVPDFPEETVGFETVIPWKMAALRKAAKQLSGGAEHEEFYRDQAWWLDDFVLFMALKQRHGMREWTTWEPGVRLRDAGALAAARVELAEEIEAQKFFQFAFFRQWAALRQWCHARDIRLMGDLPIYVAHDSAEVWANPEMFQLDKEGIPAVVAGVPPDYFSATGQLWGNPIYRWDALEADGFGWWLERFRAVLEMVDLVRVDHFRGFEAYWQVPMPAETAEHGEWVKGPGARLFRAAEKALGRLPLVAENLGVITPEVEAIRNEFGYPGMSILQFAFGTDPQGPGFRPHNYPHELAAYTGTHDCDTAMGWWASQGRGESTRSAEDIARERVFVRRYLNTDGTEMNWVMIRALMASVADTVLFPMQDVLGLGSAARMNQPATLTGNWRWRCAMGAMDASTAARLRDLTELYNR